MATNDHLLALIKAHLEENDKQFRVISLKIAAHEAKVGHTKNARDIRDLIQKNNSKFHNKVTKLNVESNYLDTKRASFTLENLVASDEVEFQINRIIKEYYKRNLLRKNGLQNRSKVLMVGEPGTGKTMTASVIANELNLTLYVVQFDKLITRFMGETSAKLREIFNQIKEYPGVYLFDEFDAIGADRSLDNDIGEMRRVLNSFLQFLEEDHYDSILLTATNNPDILDAALFRRFDDVITYSKPDLYQIRKLFAHKLSGRMSLNHLSNEVYAEALGMNHADIVGSIKDAIKISLLDNINISEKLLVKCIKSRKTRYKYKEA